MDQQFFGAIVHARRRAVGRPVGTFGTRGGRPEGNPKRFPEQAREVLGPTPGVLKAEATANEHRRRT